MFLERVYQTYTNDHGPLMSWTTVIKVEIVTYVIISVLSRKLMKLVATFRMPPTFSFNLFCNNVLGFAMRVEFMERMESECCL